MARTARASVADVCYHVMNRGNCRNTIFHCRNDYMAFEDILSKSSDHVPMRVLAYCLMPNHFHLCLWPYGDGDLGAFMSHAMNAHVKAHHHRHGTSGRIWQGRFKAFPIEQDNHLLTVLRYIERNALRANLVRKATAWPYTSLVRPETVSASPVDKGDDWVGWVESPQTFAEEQALNRCTERGTPWGSATWVVKTAEQLGLQASTRPRGRPRREQVQQSDR